MAKKQAKAKARPKFVKAVLPAGFTAVAVGGDFGAWHDWEKEPALTGKVVELGSYEGEYGKQRTMTVLAGKVKSSFSESKALSGLFDMGKKILGKTVFVRFLGVKEFGKANRKGERRTVKQFLAGVK